MDSCTRVVKHNNKNLVAKRGKKASTKKYIVESCGRWSERGRTKLLDSN
jgi:hypothetical protein